MTFDEAMSHLRKNRGIVREARMNSRWGVSINDEGDLMFVGTLGGSYPYRPTEHDRKSKHWSVMLRVQ